MIPNTAPKAEQKEGKGIFLERLREKPLFVEMEVEGKNLTFTSLDEVVSNREGGVNDDDLVDVWMKCIDGDTVHWGFVTLWKETLEIYSWDFKESVYMGKTA